MNGQFLFKTVCKPIALDPDLAEGQGDWDGQEEELVARVLPLLGLCVGRHFRELVRIHMRIRDVADGVHVDKNHIDVLFWWVGEEIGGTNVRRLLIGFDAVSGTAFPDGMEFGDVVVVTIEYKYLGSDVSVPGGQDTVRSLLLHICQGMNGLISVASNSDRSPALGAKYEIMNCAVRLCSHFTSFSHTSRQLARRRN